MRRREDPPPSATCHSLRKTRPLALDANKFKQPRCGELVPVRRAKKLTRAQLACRAAVFFG
jgi:hypothetical protein